jgi:hypothetical protein
VSAIGSYEVLERREFARCLDLARSIRNETSGKWIFKRTEVKGVAEFQQAWKAAVLERDDFDYSGYVLGNYLDARLAVNGFQPFDEQSDVGRLLSRGFTAGFESPHESGSSRDSRIGELETATTR